MLSSPFFLLLLGAALIAVAAGQDGAPIFCYDCNSGAAAADIGSLAYNLNCDTDGTINEEHHQPIECQTFCFSRVDRAPRGVVFRGCGDGLFLQDSEMHMGCFEQAGSLSYLCLCQEDRCNTHDLTAISLQFTNVSDTQAAPVSQ